MGSWFGPCLVAAEMVYPHLRILAEGHLVAGQRLPGPHIGPLGAPALNRM